MLQTGLVRVTGHGTSVNLTIEDTEEFACVVECLRYHLAENRLMYSNGTITVNVGKRILIKEEITQIRDILESNSKVTVARFWCDPVTLGEALSESTGFGVDVAGEIDAFPKIHKELLQHNDPETHSGVSDSKPVKNKQITETAPSKPAEVVAKVSHPQYVETLIEATGNADDQLRYDTKYVEKDITVVSDDLEEGLDDLVGFPIKISDVELNDRQPNTPRTEELIDAYRRNEALFIKTTCRSGEVIKYPGDIVVLADVNPGSELVADGDIIVFGRLRGFAQAGASGDMQAVIIALQLETHRIQIGQYIGIAPTSGKRAKLNRTNPKIAFIRRNSIYVTSYTGRFAGYNGGTLYDG